MSARHSDVPPTVWEAVQEDGTIVATWAEKAFSPDEIRSFRDEWYPGTRLRVTSFTRIVDWDCP